MRRSGKPALVLLVVLIILTLQAPVNVTAAPLITGPDGGQVRSTTIGDPGMFNLSETGLPDGVYILKIDSPKYSSGVRLILAK